MLRRMGMDMDMYVDMGVVLCLRGVLVLGVAEVARVRRVRLRVV